MEKKENPRYEKMYTGIMDYADKMHAGNKKRIKVGIIILIILPFVMEIIRRLTDSDKVVFLILWIFAMFLICAYIISIEYLDHKIAKDVRDITSDEEVEVDDEECN